MKCAHDFNHVTQLSEHLPQNDIQDHQPEFLTTFVSFFVNFYWDMPVNRPMNEVQLI